MNSYWMWFWRPLGELLGGITTAAIVAVAIVLLLLICMEVENVVKSLRKRP